MTKLTAEGRARINRIMAAFPGQYAAARGWSNVATVTIRTLPSLDVKSAWAIGEDGADPSDTQNWTEFPDGAYLWTVERGGHQAHVVVEVEGGRVVDSESIDPELIGLLAEMYERLETARLALVDEAQPKQLN